MDPEIEEKEVLLVIFMWMPLVKESSISAHNQRINLAIRIPGRGDALVKN